ncbi:MAG: phosphate ABC transporter substrate-binding protein PstS [Candidatus Abyssobacteria bacterium SURF_5]|uniref:Phosphate-binding protein n=1 Tax=Abyssobacteria bacterium (strain SURF_5) TaxID=2093360 RepID=A0A3A4NS07_ABYX5|nr:MAG: phosphate ABC transporter substrate-binding protein PstS [Candidatus Abyssubacteria bacterium SURF_5]
MLLIFSASAVGLGQEVAINGAGATFPYPIYSQWTYKYNQLTGVRINYQSIGSGGGIAQIKAGTVHFGASDAPLKPEELDEAGLIQFPMVIGGVVPVINVSGIESGNLKLTPSLLADIFLGKITRWNHPSLLKANVGLRLPDKAITVVHRADGSGTTWIFTDYLSKVSPQWKESIGVGTAVAWPTGIGGKGNEGIATYVQRTAGSIGYVEYAYALQNKLVYALLQNKAGNFVAPTMETFQAAAAGADWKNAPGYYLILTDQDGAESWPITGASFILVYKQQRNAKQGKTMLSFFDWCYRHGADMAKELHYVPIPMNVVDLVKNTWQEQVTSNGQPLWP